MRGYLMGLLYRAGCRLGRWLGMDQGVRIRIVLVGTWEDSITLGTIADAGRASPSTKRYRP